MTNKKFSIRKLAVGTASVAIGFSASGTIDSILANDYTNNYTVTTNPSNNYMYNSNNNKNHPLSPEEYTLKQYSHLWGNNDRSIADMIAGNINIKFSNESKSKFLGNQHISKEIVKSSVYNRATQNIKLYIIISPLIPCKKGYKGVFLSSIVFLLLKY